MNAGYPTGLALLVGLVLAIAIGVLNGFLISVVEMPPLLTTLASSLAVLGIITRHRRPALCRLSRQGP